MKPCGPLEREAKQSRSVFHVKFYFWEKISLASRMMSVEVRQAGVSEIDSLKSGGLYKIATLYIRYILSRRISRPCHLLWNAPYNAARQVKARSSFLIEIPSYFHGANALRAHS